MVYFSKNILSIRFLLIYVFLIFQSGLFAQNIELGVLPKVTADGLIERVVPTSDGKYIIKGVFDFIEGKPINRIARLNSDGSLDDTFSTSMGFDNTINDLLVSDAGEVFLAMITKTLENRVIKLNSNGAIDDAFNFVADKTIYALAWHSGNILVGGLFTTVNETSVSNLASVTTSGALNTSFNNNISINFQVNKIKLQGDKIVLIERFGDTIARLNADGTIDNSFEFDIDDLNLELGSTSHQYDYFVITDDQIIVADLVEGIIFFDADGVFQDFTDNYRFLTAMAYGNGEVWFAMQFDEVKSDVYRYLPETEEFEYAGNGNGPIHSIVFNGSNEVIVGGIFDEFNAVATSSLIKLNSMDEPVSDFGVDEFYNNGAINAIALQGENKILIGGRFTQVNGVAINNLARINLDGTLDESFTPFDTRFVDQLEVTTDNKIYINSYSYSSMEGSYVDGFHLLNADGSLDETIYTGSVWKFISLGDKKILHNFQQVFEVEGGLLQPFIDGTPPTLVHSMTVSNQGTLLVGAYYTDPGGAYTQVKSYLPDGTADPGFSELVIKNTGGTANPLISALQVAGDGKIWVGGRFNNVNGEPAISNGLLRLNEDGTLDDSFNVDGPGLNANLYSTIDFINLMNDGSAIVTGRYFTSYKGEEVNKTFIVTPTGELSDITLSINARGQILTGVALDNNQYLYGGYFNFSGNPIRTALGVLDLSEPEPEPEPPVTAVEDTESHLITLYPNPVRDFLTIQVSDQASVYFSIYSLTGQQVAVPAIPSSGDLQVDVRVLPSGLYILKGTSRAGNFYRKFIKE